MRIACSSWSFHREIPQALSLMNFPAWCGSQGIFDIEVVDSQFPSLERGYLDDFQRACGHAGVGIACLAVSNDFTVPDSDLHFAQVERVRNLLYDVAMPLRIPLVRVYMGMADTSRAGDQRALETIRGMVTDLEATGVAMALENHGRVETSPEQTMAIIIGVGSPLFGSCVDLGNLAEDRNAAISALAPMAKYVHARSQAFDDNGEETTIDYKRAFAILTEFGYDDDIAIDYEGRDDSAQGVLKTKALIEKHWYHPEAGYGQMAA